MTASGDRFHNYILERELGSGGFGTVWRARHAESGDVVALKILGGKYASGDSPRIRAEVELLAAAALTSPHIVRVLDGGIEPSPYVVMEYVEGSDLATELDRHGTLPQGDVLAIGRAIAEALKDFERAGIIHRDIKPSNVMRADDGTIKLADFGIAKILGFDQVTAAGHSPMSLAYAAPEAWEGQTSHSTDIYGLGALLFQCLAGRAPFVGTPAAILNQHRNETPDLALLPADTVPALRTLIATCLAKEPSERPPDADDVIERITLAERQHAERASDPTAALRAPMRFGPWTRQSPHPIEPWTFRCVDETTGARATVEIHGFDTLSGGDALQRAAAANAALVPFGAEKLLGASRLMLRPGEGWPALQAPFLFWVARDEREAPTMAGQLSRADVLSAAGSALTLLDAARAAGIVLEPSMRELRFDAGRVAVLRPGLPAREGERHSADNVVALLQSLPLADEAHDALAPLRTVDDLRAWHQHAGERQAFGVAREASSSEGAAAGASEPREMVAPSAGPAAPASTAAASTADTSGRAKATDGVGPPASGGAKTASGGGGGRRRPLLLGLGALAAAAIIAGVAAYVLLGGDDGDDDTQVSAGHTTTTTATGTPRRTGTGTPRPSATAQPSTTPAPAGTPVMLPEGAPPPIVDVQPPPPGGTIAPYTRFEVSVVANVDYRWKFDAVQGDLIEIRVDGADSSNVAPLVEITDSSGARLGDIDSTPQGRRYLRVSRNASSTGTFTVRVAGQGGAGVATISFVLNDRTPITSAVPISASLEEEDDVDRYQFYGEVGDLVEVRIVRSDDTKIIPAFDLVDQFGDRIPDYQYGASDRSYLVWYGRLDRTSGIHTLIVTDKDRIYTGKYEVEILRNEFKPYTIGETVTGTIDKPKQTDRYRFQCTAGQRIIATMTPPTDRKLHPAFALFDIGPTRVGDHYYESRDATPLSREYVCNFSGAYYMEVRSWVETETGTYTFRIE